MRHYGVINAKIEHGPEIEKYQTEIKKIKTMSIVRYNNRTMTPGIFDFLSDVFGEDAVNMKRSTNSTMMPAVNIREKSDSFEIELAVPGLDKKDINVEVEKNLLKISANKENEIKEEKDEFKRMEFSYRHFERSFLIPEEADAEKINAKSENGVLYIRLPKREEKMNVKKMIKVA